VCNKDYQEFGKFNSLSNTLYTQSVKYESFFVLVFYFDEETLKTCTHTMSEHNKEDDDLQLLISRIYWVIFSCFNSVYSPILF